VTRLKAESALSGAVAPTPRRVELRRASAGRTHGLSLIFWLLEQRLPVLLAIPSALALAVTLAFWPNYWLFPLVWLAVPLLGIVLPLLYLVYRSYRHDAGRAAWEEVLSFRDPSEGEPYRGRKLPMEKVYEAYIAERLDFTVDLETVLLRRNELFRFCFTWGDLKFYFGEFLRQKLGHSPRADRDEVKPVYDRGNDFYGAFLGESMIYTSAIFRDPSESLETAQRRKLETICQSVQMQPGDRHLDVGCGWGGLVVHAAREHGTQSYGITLAPEQVVYGRELAQREGVAERVTVEVRDYRELDERRFDKITCVEMAEHVGIKNFQRFLLQMRELLEDDGVFYLQIAGLRRAWQYEDFVWGLFMAKYVFPGADASCPLGFVVNQVERAGFEVHRVENCGTHYGVTIQKWYENWQKNREFVVEKYGERWFRLWSLFLAWSVLIANQGSSTVFMLTLTKNLQNDSATLPLGNGVRLNRRSRWIGSRPVATQQ
jgi:sphingolipid C9-methyltransferase